MLLGPKMRRAAKKSTDYGLLGPDDVFYGRSVDKDDDSTDMTNFDLSPNSYAVTRGGSSPQIKHEETGALPGFGDTSLYQGSAVNSTLRTAPMGANALFTGEFHVGFHFKWGNPSLTQYMFGSDNPGGPLWAFLFYGSTTDKLAFYYGSRLLEYVVPVGLQDSNWHYCCVEREGVDTDNFGLFLDEDRVAVATNNTTIGVSSPTQGVDLMATSYSGGLLGMNGGGIDGCRIRNGSSLFGNPPGGITPPATPPI